MQSIIYLCIRVSLSFIHIETVSDCRICGIIFLQIPLMLYRNHISDDKHVDSWMPPEAAPLLYTGSVACIGRIVP